jgi:predicted transcriptional regulator
MVEISEEDNLSDDNSKIEISEDFIKVVCDLTQDLMTTFSDILEKTENPIREIAEAIKEDSGRVDELIKVVYLHCRNSFPQYFFDILYENNDMFANNEELFLLPNIDFVELWKTDITDMTRATIWKYLQLILFTVVSDVNTGESFGDTAKLFEAINTDEFKQKIEASLEEMEAVFKQKREEVDEENEGEENSIPMDLPNAEQLHDHINKMMGGKIGCLAKEIAEETAGELDINMEDASSVNDVFNKLFKNPSKLMNLVKNVGTKLDSRIKSGEVKETELLQEASEFVANMKNMPGMGNLESLFSKMGVPGMGGGAKMDIGAMGRKMEQNLKNAKMKERMRNKLDKKKNETNVSENKNIEGSLVDKGMTELGMQELLYSLGEHPEKTPAENKPKNRNRKKKKKPIVTVDPVKTENNVDIN